MVDTPHPWHWPSCLLSDPFLSPSLVGTGRSRDPASVEAGQASSRTHSHAGPVQRAYGSCGAGSCSFLESSPSRHKAWERVCNVLFVWDTWFCKKLKKKKKQKTKERKKSLAHLCLCVPEKAGPDRQVSILPSPFSLAITGARPSLDRLRPDFCRNATTAGWLLGGLRVGGCGGPGRAHTQWDTRP